MLGHRRFGSDEILAEAIDLAQGVFELVRGVCQERSDFLRIVAAHLRLELRLPKVEWRYFHEEPRCEKQLGSVSRLGRDRTTFAAGLRPERPLTKR